MPKNTITNGPWQWTVGGHPIDIATYKSPGFYDNAELTGPNGEFIITCGEYDVLGWDESRAANAQAIAAVPDMIETLMDIKEQINAAGRGNEYTLDIAHFCQLCDDIYLSAGNALRKAGQID